MRIGSVRRVKMSNPIISVIIPVYKVESYLHRCIDSILNQEYKNLEVILVNDGSPDNCGNICDEYAQQDNRIKVIHKENGGLSDARNTGLEIASGEYVAFIDSDDVIHPQMYTRLYNLIQKTGAEVAQCEYVRFDKELNLQTINESQTELVYTNIQALEALIENNKLVPPVWNKLYKRELFSNIRFPKGKIHEDEYTTYKLFYAANKIAYIDLPMYYYFINNSGIMRNLNIEHKFHWIEAIEERNLFFQSCGLESLYQKSSEKLFFHLLKTRYIILRNKRVDNREDYLSSINEKIADMNKNIKDNPYLSLINKRIINLANCNIRILKIYDINNYLLEKKYRMRDFINEKRGK